MSGDWQKLLESVPLEELVEGLQRRQGKEAGLGLFASLEQSVESAKTDFGKVALERALEHLDEEDERPKKCPNCGKRARVRAKNRERKVVTLNGEITLRRNYHYCEGCKLGFYPRDRLLDLPEEGRLSPEVERRVLDMAVNDSYAESESRWLLH